MSEITIDTVVAPDLNIEDLTTINLKGTGVWDKLLQTMRVQLNEQFEKNRITGPSYGQVYASTYESTLQAAITLLLAKERQALEFKQLELQNTLVQAQVDQIHDQMQKTPYELQILQSQAEEAKIKVQQEQFNLDNILPAQHEQILAQTASIEKETELKTKQLELVQAQIDVQKEQLTLLTEQVAQAKAQTEYYAQKVITEKAQTDASVIGDGSVIDVQVDLMNAQKDGYQRNAEQQTAQLLTNTWNVRRQTDEDTSANTTNLLDDATVGKAVQALLAGIGVTVTPA